MATLALSVSEPPVGVPSAHGCQYLVFWVSVIVVVGEKLHELVGTGTDGVAREPLLGVRIAAGAVRLERVRLTIGSHGITPGRNAYGSESVTTAVSGPEAGKL